MKTSKRSHRLSEWPKTTNRQNVLRRHQVHHSRRTPNDKSSKLTLRVNSDEKSTLRQKRSLIANFVRPTDREGSGSGSDDIPYSEWEKSKTFLYREFRQKKFSIKNVKVEPFLIVNSCSTPKSPAGNLDPLYWLATQKPNLQKSNTL